MFVALALQLVELMKIVDIFMVIQCPWKNGTMQHIFRSA